MTDKLFKCNNIEIRKNQPALLCGILNITPDSFSDGGRYNSVEAAVRRALQLVEDGAGMLDIGGESTRPGSTPVSAKEEINRICPVIQAIKKEPKLRNIPISVDTWKAKVADTAISAGADIINDITGLLGHNDMASLIGHTKAGIIIMFNPTIARPYFESTKNFPTFGDSKPFTKAEETEFIKLPIVDAMIKYFDKALALAAENNIPTERIMLDPGIGFGLSKKENLQLIKNIDVIHKKGFCSFLGVSRKRFIVQLLADAGFNSEKDSFEGLENIDYGSAFLSCLASFTGVNVLRIHDIPKHKQATAIAEAIRFADTAENIVFHPYK